MRRLIPYAVLIAVCLVAALAAETTAAAATWRITKSPGSMDQGKAVAVTVVFSNQGGPSGKDALGCVKIKIPASFEVGAVSVTDEPGGTSWSASTSGSTTVTIKAANAGDRLGAHAPGDSVSVRIVVTGDDSGHHDWAADAFATEDCGQGFGDPHALGINVKAKPTPKPTAVPTPKPTPKPKPTPTPKPVVTPAPVVTARPAASPTRPPRPSGAATPRPSASAAVVGSTNGGHTPSPGSGAGSTSSGGSPAPSGGPTRPGVILPGATIHMPGVDGIDSGDPPVVLRPDMGLLFGNDFEWVVPGLVLTIPGLLLALIVLLQAVGALAWVPIARRRLGGDDPRLRATARRRPRRVVPAGR